MSVTQRLFRFGVFELNLDTEELRKSGTIIKLPPQSFKLLGLLASHAGQVVSRDEIQGQLWGQETFVDFEHGVNKCIKQIRNALGDNADNPLYVETLPRHGYRFIAPVVSKTIPAPRPKVVESESGEIRSPFLVATSAREGVSATGAAVQRHSATIVAPGLEAAAVPQVRSRVWRVRLFWVVIAVALAGLIGGALYWRAHKRRVLTEKDTIVVAEFDNKTGDPVFDVALREGLSFQLEQSTFLNLLSDERIAQTLALMTQPKDARLTEELAREVCLRTGSAATIEGSISTLGSLYLVELKALDCHNGVQLADEEVRADNKEQVIQKLGDAAKKLRVKLGESLASVQKYDVPLENVTTSSLQALKAYSLGRVAFAVKADYPTAIALFKRAIDIDPKFAMAYAGLGGSYSNLSENALATENFRKAYELRDRVSERERLAIEVDYADHASGNVDAARKAYELWAQTYPRDVSPPTNVGAEYTVLGDYNKALAAFQDGLKFDPGNGLLYANLAATYLFLNRLDEAKATVQAAQARQLDSPGSHLILYEVEFLQHDAAGMEHDEVELMGKPAYEDQLLYFESDAAASAGQFVKANGLTRRAVESAERAELKEAAAAYEAEAAVREALIGNMEEAKQQARAALALSKGRDVEAIAAIALALAGDATLTPRLARDLNHRFPEDTIVQFNYLPSIRAAAALRARRPAEALNVLEPAMPYELGYLSGSATFNLYPVYFRGQAYLAAHQAGEAAAEFQKIFDHPGVVLSEPIGPLARLGLGRAYALSGDTAKAKTSYQDFLTLWKNADPDIPILKEAKAEYAKLQ